MEDGLFLWFLCGCYLIGGITIGWFGGILYRDRKERKTGTGRWDWTNRKYYGSGDQ